MSSKRGDPRRFARSSMLSGLKRCRHAFCHSGISFPDFRSGLRRCCDARDTAPTLEDPSDRRVSVNIDRTQQVQVNSRGATCQTTSTLNDWSKPAAAAIPKEGYFTLEQGRYGPTYPRTPACHGFTIIAKIKPGTEGEIRAYGKKIEDTIAASPHALAPLQLHYLRWVLFDIGPDKYFMYQGIFDTDFDKYTEDAVQLFKATGVDTVFEKLEGFPTDWKTNAPAFIKFVREHQCPSFLEYGEYPYVSAAEIKKALALKQAFSSMLDQMQ